MKDDLYGLYGKNNEEPWYSIIPIILVSLVPLIVHGKLLELRGDYYKYWTGAANSLDIFSYYKSWAIIILAIAALIVFIIKLSTKSIEIRKNHIYIPLFTYMICVILSSIFSEYGQISLFGFVERYEGVMVICAYLVIFFICANLFDKKSEFKAVLISIIVSAILIGTIGIFQYFGHDFFKTSLGNSILISKGLGIKSEGIKFNFGAKIIYSTLYHYNYVGSYMAMIFPLTFTMTILLKNKFYKIILGIVSFLMFLNLILCHSRAGIIGGVVATIVLAIILRRYIIKNWKYALGLLVLVIVTFIGFNKYSDGMLANRVASLLKDGESIRKVNSGFYIKDIYSENNKLKVETSKFSFNVVNEGKKLGFTDENNKPIDFELDSKNNSILLKDSKYSDVHITFTDLSLNNENNNMELNLANSKLPIFIDNGKFEFSDKRKGNVEIKKVDKFGFEGKERLGSARGYIWSRGIPLIKNNVLFGYGPDTFAAVFPQTDFMGKIIAYDTSSMIVDKAHNLYLQQAVNTGLISLIAFLAMFVMYIIDSFKIYFKNDFSDFYSVIGLAILTAVCGYLGAGCFNDSVVSVAPVFWVLFGIGVSVNYKLKNNDEQKNESIN